MNGNPKNPLTPEQAADVIRYFHDSENHEARRNGWRDHTSLGLAALHAASDDHSILPDETPILTFGEMGAGLRYLEGNDPPDEGKNPPNLPEPTGPTGPPFGTLEYEAYAKKLDALVDKGPFTYDEARQILDDDE